MTNDFDCTRFDGFLPAALAGDLEPADASLFEAHARACAKCRALLDDERRAERATRTLLSHWAAPDPPEGFAERVLERIVHESEDSGDSADPVDRLWRRWRAPALPRGFRSRVLAAWQRRSEDAPTASRSPVRRRARSLRVGVAAAALLLAGALGVSIALRSSAPNAHDDSLGASAPQWITVDEALAHYGNGTRLRMVVQEPFPGGIGSFDGSPFIADLQRRNSGNAFHQELRRVLVESGVPNGGVRR